MSGLREGMVVVDVEGQPIGRIKQILPDGKVFRVDCRLAPDYYVPLGSVTGITDDQVTLRVTKQQAAYMGWELRPK